MHNPFVDIQSYEDLLFIYLMHADCLQYLLDDWLGPTCKNYHASWDVLMKYSKKEKGSISITVKESPMSSGAWSWGPIITELASLNNEISMILCPEQGILTLIPQPSQLQAPAASVAYLHRMKIREHTLSICWPYSGLWSIIKAQQPALFAWNFMKIFTIVGGKIKILWSLCLSSSLCT